MTAARRGLGAALTTAALLAAPVGSASAQVMDREIYTYVALDELEYAPGTAERPVMVDGQAWIGGDYNRLWIKAHGDHSTRDRVGELEMQALYGRFIAPFWDAQVGVRLDAHRGGEGSRVRGHLVVGLEGLAPYWFEVEPALFVSHEGDVSAGLEASYELLVTQRLILEPEVEARVALQDVPEWDVASGLDEAGVAARLRYQIVREFAPYVGIGWSRSRHPAGETIEDVGPTSDSSLLVGVRAWY